MTNAYGNRFAPYTARVEPTLESDAQIQNLMAAAVCEFIFVSIVNVTFLPGFHREALKRALNRKQGTSEISQATRAR